MLTFSRPLSGLLFGNALLLLVAGCPGDDTSGTSSDNGDSSTGSPTTDTPTTDTPTTDTPTTDTPTTGDPTTGDPTTGEPTTGDPTTGDPTTGETTTTGDTDSAGDTSTGGASSSSTGGGLLDCGNGMVEAGEDCDSDDIGGSSCADQGFDDGVLACNNDTCAFDMSGCFNVEALNNDNGNCGFQELGCSDAEGTGGNPQDMVECYEFTLTPPVDVTEVEYSLEDLNLPLPDALDLVVFEWAGVGNPPGNELAAIPLDPMMDIVGGLHTYVLPGPVNVTTSGFCIGFRGTDPADGFRVDFSDADNQGESYIVAETCGAATFAEFTDLGFPGNFCIHPTITSNNL